MVTISDALAIAVQHQRAGRLPEAAEICRRILDVEPEHVGARSLLESIARHRNLQAAQHCLVQGNALAREGKSAEAVACCRQAVELAPDFAPAHNNLSVLLRSQGNWDEAVACGRRALELEPDHAEVHYNLGAALQERGDLDDALACYRKAVELKADFADGHMGLAGIHLLRGDFRQGWLEYEWRWRTKQVPPRPFRQPLWDGGSLAGKTILLYPEQGLGDVIQFIRYAPLVKRLGATVIVECQKPLLPLLATCAGIDRLVGQGDQLPPFATHSPLLSLPRIFQTSLDKMPAAGPYLFAAPALIESWRKKLSDLPGYKIGIHWQGRPGQGPWRVRNIPLRQFAPLAEIPGVRLISLQKGAGCEELAQVREHFPVVELGDEVDQAAGAFMDTAAIIKNLDLVITCDTALAHLAGALGAPVWVALPRVPEWRWLLDRSDSPWYPTMRLFRQKALGDWPSVFAEIRRALGERPGFALPRAGEGGEERTG
jgi:hypothetical protein